MSTAPTIHYFENLPELVDKFRNDLTEQNFILLYAYNGIGKTRLSMEFKQAGKQFDGDGNVTERDTLYFNAFTEDLFYWDNDFENDTERKLMINSSSNFFNGFRELALEEKIFSYLERYATFDYRINYDDWYISFNKAENTNIKISRGEETIFKWCIFMAICELTIDGAEAYNWVKYFYIDDPISSLDDTNAISVGCDLAELLKRSGGRIKTIISSHHILFYNVICNELKWQSHRKYFLHKDESDKFSIRKTTDTPFFHHVASLGELKQVAASGNIKTFHFNTLRTIMEKTASFFGYDNFKSCLHGIDEDILYNRALNLLSHGKYSIYEPVEMSEDNKTLFRSIMEGFLNKYEFELPELLLAETAHVEEIIEPVEETTESTEEITVPIDGVSNLAATTEPTMPITESTDQTEEVTTPIVETPESFGETTELNTEAENPVDDASKTN